MSEAVRPSPLHRPPSRFRWMAEWAIGVALVGGILLLGHCGLWWR